MEIERPDGHLLEIDTYAKQRNLEELLRTIPKDQNPGFVLEVSTALVGSKGSPMFREYILQEVSRGSLLYEGIKMIEGDQVSLKGFPEILHDEWDGIFGWRARKIEQEALSGYNNKSLNFKPMLYAAWRNSYEDHYGVAFDPLETTQ